MNGEFIKNMFKIIDKLRNESTNIELEMLFTAAMRMVQSSEPDASKYFSSSEWQQLSSFEKTMYQYRLESFLHMLLLGIYTEKPKFMMRYNKNVPPEKKLKLSEADYTPRDRSSVITSEKVDKGLYKLILSNQLSDISSINKYLEYRRNILELQGHTPANEDCPIEID